MADHVMDDSGMGRELAPVEKDMSVRETLTKAMTPTNFDQVWQQCDALAQSSLVPDAFRGKPGDIMLCWQTGVDLGITNVLQCVQNIAVINKRPTIWGDMMLAVCRASHAWDESSFKEYITGEGDAMVATCECARKDGNVSVVTFSMEDAKKAGLLSKQGPWQQYTKRMLKMRARGYALRDTFTPELKGIRMVEEERDITPEGEARPERTQSSTAAASQRTGTASRAGSRMKDRKKARRGDTYDAEPESQKTGTRDSWAASDDKSAPVTHPSVNDSDDEKVSYTYAQIADAIQKADGREALDAAGHMTNFFGGELKDMQDLRELYKIRLQELGLSKSKGN